MTTCVVSRVATVVKLTKLITSLKWKNILVSLCAQRMNPNPSLSAAITPYEEEGGYKESTNFTPETNTRFSVGGGG